MAASTSFDEVDFPASFFSFGSTAGHKFSTDVIVMDNGAERRNINWSVARHTYSVKTGNQAARSSVLLESFPAGLIHGGFPWMR